MVAEDGACSKQRYRRIEQTGAADCCVFRVAADNW